MNTQHQQITRDAIEGASYDTVLYVMNGENIGTTDDWRYLAYLKERIRTKRMIFVVNKLDRFKQGEDSVEDTLHKAGEDVEKAGFTDYLLCPISAYAAFLAKKQLWGEPLDQEQQDELTYFTLKFRNQAFDLGRFCPLPEPVAAAIKGGCREKQQEVLVDILLKSGVAGLEFQLTQ